MNIIKKILSKKINFKIELFSKKKILIYCSRGTVMHFNHIVKKYKKDVLFLHKDEFNFIILVLTVFKIILSKEKNFFLNYIKTIVELYNIKVLVSDLDNYSFLYTLKNKINSIKVFLIQNGHRGNFNDVFGKLEKNKKYKVDDFIVFNNDIKKKYENYVEANYHILGSYKLSNFLRSFKAKKKIIPNISILFISQYRDQEDKLNFVNTKIARYLNKFSCENNLQFKINFYFKANQLNLKKEKNYYKKSGISDKKFLINKNSYESYKNLLKSKLVIGCDTTMGYESLALQKKTIFLTIRENSTLRGCDFGWPGNYKKEGFFWLKKFSEPRIEKMIKKVIKCKNKVWVKKIKKYNKDLAFQDLYYLKKIEKIIKGYLA